MTFYEAALRVLESAGRPLHVQEITEQSIAQNMLSHVGKAPDKTMLSRLAAMARRTRDRRVIVTAKDTFALAEWAIPEDPEALAQTAVPEPNPEELLPALRPAERHPDARPDNVRASGRPADRRRRFEEDEARARRRRYSGLPELAFALLSDAGKPLKPAQIAELLRERDGGASALSTEQILTALVEENQRRIDSGRRPQFVLSMESGEVGLEPVASETAPADVQAAFAAALGIAPRELSAAPTEGLDSANAGVRLAAREAKRAMAREVRRRLLELDLESFHKAFVKVLQALGFRELKVAKRSREGVLLTARKREGSVDLRFAVRLVRGTTSIDRRAVQELRRDLGHYSAQAGLIASVGELRGDARAEAQSPGALAALWCAEALAEKFIEAGAGVTTAHVPIFEIDDRFFVAARVEAEQAKRRRDERVRERQERRAPEEGERRPLSEAEPERAGQTEMPGDTAAGGAPAEHGEAPLAAAPRELAGESIEGEDEQPDEADADVARGEGSAPVPAERKRRRRRRRGRRGRRPGEPSATAASQPPAAAPTSNEEKSDPPPSPPSAPENEPS